MCVFLILYSVVLDIPTLHKWFWAAWSWRAIVFDYPLFQYVPLPCWCYVHVGFLLWE